MAEATPITLPEALAAARETRALRIGHGVINEAPAILRQHFGAQPAVIVADVNTMRAAGEQTQAAFSAASYPTREPFVFTSRDLYAEYRFVEELECSFRTHGAIPVAVGSGTINDITKLAAHRTNRPYVCVATAASMDGYTAFGASITHQGSKQTFDCPAPTAVVADLDVICAAPGRMSAWGYADLLAKVTAGADWIVADALGVEPIEPLAWNIVQGRLHDAVNDPAGVREAVPGAMAGLVEGLMLGGFAMQATKSSRPASGAEHQFSHLWDMQHHTHEGEAPSHGLKVGIGTLGVTALYEWLMEQPLDSLDVEACVAEWPGLPAWLHQAGQLFAEADLRAVAAREIAAKCCTREELRMQLQTLRAVWPDMRQRLKRQLIPFPALREMLRAAGAAVDPEQIGISRGRLRASFEKAFFIRRRFTVLDLAMRTRLLPAALDAIFGPGGCWPE